MVKIKTIEFPGNFFADCLFRLRLFHLYNVTFVVRVMAASSLVSTSGFWTSSSSSFFADPPSSSFITAGASAPGTKSTLYPEQITNELSASNQVVNTHVYPGAWSVKERTEAAVPPHVPIFAYRGKKASVQVTYEKSIRALNLFLEERGAEARAFWLRRASGAPSLAEKEGIISREQYDHLMRTPTSAWMRDDIVKYILTDEQNYNRQLLRYLFSDGIVSMWNFIGFKPNEDAPMISTTLTDALKPSGMHALSFSGHIISVNNLWGNSIRSFDILGFSLDPIKEEGDRKGIFILQPVRSHTKCTGRVYFDVSGFPLHSHIYWIGTVKDWTSKPTPVDEQAVWAYLRLVEAPRELAESYSPDKSLTIWCHR